MESNQVESDWWWIDYLENELGPGFDQELKQLLQNSEEDQKNFEAFRCLKSWIACSDWTDQLPIEARAERLRHRVMAEIYADGDSHTQVGSADQA